jgi:hypothetical protein
MKQIASWIGYGILTFVLFDVIVLMFTMLQIGNGGYTPHIPFWDRQMRLIVGVNK